MDSVTADVLLEELLAAAGLQLARRERLRVWELSGVERVHLAGGSTRVFKYARKPFTGEGDTLAHLNRMGFPAPRLDTHLLRDDTLGLLLEDLGQPTREATLAEGAAAALRTHHTPPPAGLPRLDTAALERLPDLSLAHLQALEHSGRWRGTADIASGLTRLARSAQKRAEGAETPPFGLCHSEFHPTSLHIGPSGQWRLLDWARAFTGPGLLDLVSWQGTIEPPDPGALQDLLTAYTAAGGPPEAAADRGGLPAIAWAIGWHRMWMVEWFLDQARVWMADHVDDAVYRQVVARHVNDALTYLRA